MSLKNKLQGRPQKHYSSSLFNVLKVLFTIFSEILFCFPELIRLRRLYKKNKKSNNPFVVLIGDNLDEVNGIALHVRLLTKLFKKQNRNVYAVGVAYHSHQARIENSRLLLAPSKISVDQPGYSGSESSVPYLKFLLRLMRRYSINLIEFETPGVFSFMMLFVSKIIGIKTVHHYRTDALYYVKMLIKSKIAVKIVCNAIIWFTRQAGTIVLPSESMRSTIQAMKISNEKIIYIPRGVDTNRFSSLHKKKNMWAKLVSHKNMIRLLYMGRISKEKNLEILKEILPNILRKEPNFEFCFVGDGPYKIELENFFKPFSRIYFTGFIQGKQLAQIMADADLFVFPSHTDTFGNSVAEALASGLPSIVSNRGGPSQIVENQKSGIVCNYQEPLEFQEAILDFLKRPKKLNDFKIEARKIAESMTHERTTEKFWEFYQQELKIKN